MAGLRLHSRATATACEASLVQLDGVEVIEAIRINLGVVRIRNDTEDSALGVNDYGQGLYPEHPGQ